MSKFNIVLQLTRAVISSLPPGALQGVTLAAAIVATASACLALAIMLPAQPVPVFHN